MEPLAIDLNLLRALTTPDLTLDVGRVLMVRVAEAQATGRGLLSLAGMLIEAELPEGVTEDQELKLMVRELTPEKVVLAIQNDGQEAQPQTETETPIPMLGLPIIPMPQGGSVMVNEREAGGSAQPPDGSHSVKLRYDAPTLGPLDMHFVLDPQGSLRLSVTLTAGEPLDSAQSAAPALQDRLTDVTGRRVSVSINARRQQLEVFA